MQHSRLGLDARKPTLTALALASVLVTPAWGQQFPNLPITPEQNATAQKVAQAGVPLSELATNAPDVYTIKAGDTLWDISKLFLKSPWRWPELWGMNMQEIRNPHLIYPGQTLYLHRRDGRALLSGSPPAADGSSPTAPASDKPAAAGPDSASSAAPADRGAEPAPAGMDVVRLSPRVRAETWSSPLSALQTRAIEPFLVDPLIVEEDELRKAPRIVAASEGRVMIGRGDRVYARGPSDAPLLDDQRTTKNFRVFRDAKPLKDPESGRVLGYEAEFLGKVALVRSEGRAKDPDSWFGSTVPVPATVDVLQAKTEMLAGDRLVPEAERQFLNFVPHAPQPDFAARIVSIYGSNAVVNAAQNQVVVVNRGRRDGMEAGHVLAILKDGALVNDRTDSSRRVKLPNERNGLLMVFRTFDKLAYGLILENNDSVRVGDRLASPQ